MKIETPDRIGDIKAGKLNFIKFVISKNKGLELIEQSLDKGLLTIKHDNHIDSYYLESKRFKQDTYPLLLTRAVEGINETDPWKIDIFFLQPTGWNWSYKDYIKYDSLYDCADRAKEAALSYVMESEQKRQDSGIVAAILEDIEICKNLINKALETEPLSLDIQNKQLLIYYAVQAATAKDLEECARLNIKLEAIKKAFSYGK